MTEFFDSSPELKDYQRGATKMKHPWNQLEVGKSFVVLHSDGKLETLRASASKWGKKLERRFVVVDHGTEVGFEIGRIK